jgi:hypothetical protein
VTLVAIIALLLALFFFVKRKKQLEETNTQDMETADPLAAQHGHELITSANTHELAGKEPGNYVVKDEEPHRREGLQEMEEQHIWPVHSISLVNTEGTAEIDAPITIPSTETGTNPASHRISELDAPTYTPQQADTHSSPTDPAFPNIQKSGVFISTDKTSPDMELEPAHLAKNAYSLPTEPTSSAENSEDKVEALRKRMQRVREDKERLQKIQALKELEDELQAELLMEQKKAAGI